jgi:hypothetical protein
LGKAEASEVSVIGKSQATIFRAGVIDSTGAREWDRRIVGQARAEGLDDVIRGQGFRILSGLVPIISAVPDGPIIFGMVTGIGFWLGLWAVVGLPIAFAHGYDPRILKIVRQGF